MTNLLMQNDTTKNMFRLEIFLFGILIKSCDLFLEDTLWQTKLAQAPLIEIIIFPRGGPP